MFVKTLEKLGLTVGNRRTFGPTKWRRLLSISRSNDDKFIVVNETSSSSSSPSAESMKFPSVWLRDNCKCSQCFHQSSQSRSHDWDKFDVNVKPHEIKVKGESKQIQIKWSDGHESNYDLQWLKERDFSSARRKAYVSSFYRPKAELWSGKDFNKIIEKFEFKDVIHDDDALQSWLEALARKGVALINNAPLEETVVRQLADRVGFIRRTTYGEEFVVKAKPGATNYAYLSTPLPLHTDLPYYEYKPSVNILHCLQQSNSAGGQNLLVDAFHIAERLKQESPKDFKILTETLVDWNDIASEGDFNFHNIFRAPVVMLDSEGEYMRINHSIPQRDSHFSVELDAVYPWYEAYAKFVALARRDAFAFKTKPGDVLTFNNIRLLHGRTGYDDTEQNVRYIIGAYLDWDIIYSKLRVLKTQQNERKRN